MSRCTLPFIRRIIYADDIQLYSSLPNYSNILPDNTQLCKCSSIIRSWLISNNLLINPSQYALLNISSNSHYFHIDFIEGIPIIPYLSVLNIGVY